MPARPPRICRKCGKAIADGQICPAHPPTSARDRERDRRAGGLRRLYDTASWRRTKRTIKARDPMCTIRVLCGGRAPSTDVDHKVRAEIYVERHGGDETYFFDPENLRGACHEDHSRKTALEQRGAWREPDDLTRGTAKQK